MSFEQPPIEKEKSAKEVFWDRIERELEEKARRAAQKVNEGMRENKQKGIIVGEPKYVSEEVDKKVKQTLVALNVMGLRTICSCEGHKDYGLGAPVIDIRAAGLPGRLFKAEKKRTARCIENGKRKTGLWGRKPGSLLKSFIKTAKFRMMFVCG